MKTELLLTLTALLALADVARAQGTAFTYQGRLSENGAPAQGAYDFEFRVFDAETSGTQQGGTVTINALGVTNGLFTATLNPGAGVFTGVDRWLEIGVITNGGGAFTTLAPRQSITPTPYAIRATEAGYAGAAATANSFTGPLAGEVAGPQGATTVALVGGETAANVAAGAGAANAATSANTPHTIVKRDGSGNFSAGDIIAASFSGSGAGLTNVNAVTLDGLSGAGLWRTNGNVGANPANGAFLGTADNQPLEFKVNNQRGLRLEPTARLDTVNVIGGSARNSVAAGVVGATIGGGGSGDYFGVRGHRVEADFGTVSGGSLNSIQPDAAFATIGGGTFNTIEINAFSATIGGGINNTIQANASYATVGGGVLNMILPSAEHATIGGGYQNTIQNAHYATVPGGAGNTAGGSYSFAAGHDAKALHHGAFVWSDGPGGGFSSTANNQFLIRAGGGVGINNNNPNGAALAVNGNVTVSGTIGSPGYQPLEFTVNDQRGLRLEPTVKLDTVNVIGGSARNSVGVGVLGATIGGGGAGDYYGRAVTNRVEADFGTVAGGFQNTIGTFAIMATIGGGEENTIQSDASSSTIGGGYSNTIQAYASSAFIGGGYGNGIGNNAGFGTVGGGHGNEIGNNAGFATISGGKDNVIQLNAGFATIPGGSKNSATSYAFAAGYRAKANDRGAFVWADSTDADFASTANDQFLIRATGGVGIGTTSPGAPLQIGDANTPNSQGMMRFTSRSGTGAATRSWDIGVPEGDEDIGGKFYSFVIDDPALGTEPELVIRWDSGNVGIGTSTPVSKLQVNGTVTATAFNPPSDRNLKENFAPVSPREVLEKVAALPISRWNFIGDAATPHVGPMAQDFHAAFRLGTDERHIATVDADGVALAAIQGLNQKVEEQGAALKSKNARIAELEQRLSAIETLLKR